MRKTKRQLVLIVVVALGLFPVLSHAGAFKVNPLKLVFTPDTRSTALEIHNTSERKISVQVETRQWSQDEIGKDQYQSTKDLLFFPKIVTLAPGAKRMIRVSYRGDKSLDSEKAYRIFVQELVDRSQEQGALSFSLRFSIPVFIRPNGVTAQVALTGVERDSDAINIILENKGNAHSLIKEIEMTGLDDKQKELFFRKEKGWYVLPGATNVFAMPLSLNECRSISSLEFAARETSKTHITRLDRNSISCQ